MTTASVGEVESKFSTFLKASEGSPVVVTRRGKPVAVIVGVHDEEEIEMLLMAHSPQLRKIVEASRKQIREGKGLSENEFWAEVAKMRARQARRAKTVRTKKPS